MSEERSNRGLTPSHRPSRGNPFAAVVGAILLIAILYGGYFWFIRRVVVSEGQVLVVLKKNGTRSLPGDQIVVPRPPAADSPEFAEWEKTYGDVNGILEQVYPEGTYFAFSPFDYERFIYPATIVGGGKSGVVIRKFGGKLDEGQVIADVKRAQRGPLPLILQPGRYNEYSNPFAYDVKEVEPISVNPGNRGVVTVFAGSKPTEANQYLVGDNEQGVQRRTETEGFIYVNPYVKRVTPISITSQRFEMAGADAIRFPSSDSFEIKLEGFVEWSVDPEKLPLLYVQYGMGSELLSHLDDKVILPYSRSFCRLVGSQFRARDFISGDTRQKFQNEFESRLRVACELQGIKVLQALVRDIVPPQEIKNPINDREVAKQQVFSLQQQIQVARSQTDLVRQQETATQNQAIGEANKQVVTVVNRAQQESNVAIIEAQQQLEVAKLQLEAARKQADALVATGTAEANVILLKKQAEADPLRQQIAAFGDGNAYAQFFFYQKVAPSMKSILTNSDGPFADIFKQFAEPPRTTPPTK